MRAFASGGKRPSWQFFQELFHFGAGCASAFLREAAGKTSFEACSTAGIARCLLVSAQIFENLVGRKYWNFVRTLS